MCFEVKKFSCHCIASTYNDVYLTVCNEFSFLFESGVYVLKGEIDSGAWAFTYAVSHPTKNSYFSDYTVFSVNHSVVKPEELSSYACYLDEKQKNIIERNSRFAAKVKKLIKKHHYKMTCEQLFDMFDIPKEYIDRKIKYLGICNYQRYLAMKGLIEGKTIFTTAWCGSCGIIPFNMVKIGKILQDNNCLFIIPSSEKNQFDESFKNLKVVKSPLDGTLSLIPEL